MSTLENETDYSHVFHAEQLIQRSFVQGTLEVEAQRAISDLMRTMLIDNATSIAIKH